MRIQQFIRSHIGKLVIAMIIGFGLSTLFRKTCKDKQCLQFKGPPLKDVDGQDYAYNDKCYQFKPNPIKCSSLKKTVRFA